MSEEKNENLINEEESTVFSAPPTHNDKPEKGTQKKKLLFVALGLLTVAVLSLGVFAAVKFIPQKDQNETDVEKTQSIVNVDASTVTALKLTTPKKVTEFYSETDQSETTWYIKEYEKYKSNSAAILTFIEDVCNIEGKVVNGKDDAAFGTDNPRFKVDVSAADNSFSLIIGSKFADGTYVKFVGNKTVYFSVNNEKAEAICKSEIDFASIESYLQATFETDVSNYKDSGGALISFDTLSIGGNRYGKTFVFSPNTDELSKEKVPYVMISPEKGYAQKVEDVFKLFTDSLGVSGAYSFDASPETLAKYKLDNPDIEVVLKIGTETKRYLMTVVDNTYCAVYSDTFDMVRKVTSNYIPFFALSKKDFYFNSLLPYSLSQVKTVTSVTAEKTREFAVSYNSDETVVTSGGKTVEGFEEFFNTLSELKVTANVADADFSSNDFKFKLTFDGGNSVDILFKKGSGTKYNFKIGNRTGQITSSSYNAMINKLNKL